MIFWHPAGTIFLFRWIFRDPNVDLRFLVLGALLSDLIDKPVGLILFSDTFGTGRIYGHTMLFAVVLMLGGVAFTSRGSLARRRAITVAVGVFFHLLLDGMWSLPETLLWPAFGTSFPPGPADYWGGLLGRILTPTVIIQEMVGLVYLTSLWVGAELSTGAARRRLLHEGRIVISEPVE
jgi:membrane-bound metal-dependent hydrolase YbcI (DUF457 family)